MQISLARVADFHVQPGNGLAGLSAAIAALPAPAEMALADV
jgi:hypothetical protein